MVYIIPSTSFPTSLSSRSSQLMSSADRVWELAAAVRTSSQLPDRAKLGGDLMQLGDLSRDLSDEIA